MKAHQIQRRALLHRLVVTLSGGTVSALNAAGTATAQIAFRDDANVYSALNGGADVQISAATDHTRPADASPGALQIRYTNLTGTALASGTASEDTWHSLSTSDFVLIQEDAIADATPVSSTFDVEIREGTGPVLASASYTLTANRLAAP